MRIARRRASRPPEKTGCVGRHAIGHRKLVRTNLNFFRVRTELHYLQYRKQENKMTTFYLYAATTKGGLLGGVNFLAKGLAREDICCPWDQEMKW